MYSVFNIWQMLKYDGLKMISRLRECNIFTSKD